MWQALTSTQLCNNGGPCVACDLGYGQRGYCSNPLDASRDFCNNPQFQGLCACTTVNIQTQPQPQVADQGVQSSGDSTIGISFMESPVTVEDFSISPDTATIQEFLPFLPPDTESEPESETQSQIDTVPDYQSFMIPRGLSRDHIRGEAST